MHGASIWRRSSKAGANPRAFGEYARRGGRVRARGRVGGQGEGGAPQSGDVLVGAWPSAAGGAGGVDTRRPRYTRGRGTAGELAG
eukprot:6200610-Pleurochrysis_carterae.AAC.4